MGQSTRTYAHQSASTLGRVNIIRALFAGAVGTLALTALLHAGSVMGIPKMDVPTVLGTVLVADPPRPSCRT